MTSVNPSLAVFRKTRSSFALWSTGRHPAGNPPDTAIHSAQAERRGESRVRTARTVAPEKGGNGDSLRLSRFPVISRGRPASV